MAGSSKGAVVLAVAGNGALTVLKFVTFALSGSGAMLSEAIHSLADTANQALLWIGIERSSLGPTPLFHYGRGAERFFFALMSAVGIFVLGCGFTLYHGIHNALDPPALEIGWAVYAVLGVSLVVDGIVLRKALLVAFEQKKDKGLIRFLRESSDPTLAAVLLEDAVATTGVIVAAIGISLSEWTGSHTPDVVATLVIGAMLGAVAIWLGWVNRTLILGRSIPLDVQSAIVRYLEEQPTVERVHAVRSRIIGADRFKLTAGIDWNGRALGALLEPWVAQNPVDLGDEGARAAFARDFGEHLTEAIGDEIDRIEAELREHHPELAFLDLESE